MPSSLVSLSSSGHWDSAPDEGGGELVTRANRWPHEVLSVVSREDASRRAWVSKPGPALLEEIGTTLEREGVAVARGPVSHSRPAFLHLFRGRWHGWRNVSTRAAARAGGFAAAGSVLAETLEVLSGSMPRYADWLTEQVLTGNPQSILEVGAGTGTITTCLARCARVVAVEPADDSRAILEHNVAGIEHVDVFASLDSCRSLGPFDAIVLINVLEHIENDVDFLADLRDLLAPGGYVAVLSPAHNSLYSRFDASIGHVRRYNRKRLRLTYQRAGYRNSEVRYFNFVGAFLWFAVNRLAGRSSASEGQTALYDRVIVPISRAADRARIRPFGQSVVGIGRN